MNDTTVREEMCVLARSLFERGLTPGSSGNLSARLPNGGFLMTPTNSSLGFLDPNELSVLDDAGAWVSGEKPTKEAFLHLSMYRGRSSLNAISHLHSTYCVCLSCLTDTDPEDVIPPITPYVRMRAGKVALVPYARPGDDSIAPVVEQKARSYVALIIRNHGPVVGGRSLRDSVFAMEELEEAAKVYLLLKGQNVQYLGQEQINLLETLSLLPNSKSDGSD
jgi:ribulose-5-phosphate 4-epimerase/fuculose-1-phosphate aldolase